jgi:DNA-binding NarL/FixJ family response regulator
LQVVGEASDGLQAVRKAQELEPDLILLDIGLPNLNGIMDSATLIISSGSIKLGDTAWLNLESVSSS